MWCSVHGPFALCVCECACVMCACVVQSCVCLAYHIPDAHRLVRAARVQPMAVGVEGERVDAVGVTLERGETRVAGQVPDAHRLVIASRGQPLAVGVEGERVDGAGVALESGETLTVRLHGSHFLMNLL